MKRSQRNKKRKLVDRVNAKNSYNTTIDNEEQDILTWAKKTIEDCSKARDKVLPLKYSGGLFFSSDFVGRAKRNYDFYHDIRRRLQEEIELNEKTPCVNWLLQRMRTKFGILIDAMVGWRYKPIVEDQVDFVHNLNQVLRLKLKEQEYPEAALDLLATVICYGTAHLGLFHTFAEAEPHGAQFFETLDPLGVLVNFGAKRIGGKTSFKAKTVIIIRMRSRGKIEREYQKSFPTEFVKNWVMPKEYSLMHALYGEQYSDIDDRIPEVMIFHDDDTEEEIVDRIERKVPVMIKETGEPFLDEKGEKVYETATDEKGEILYDEKPTGNLRMKYPNYRLMVFAGGLVMYDGVNPYSHGDVPIIKVDNTWDGVNYWAMGDPDIGADSQKAIIEIDHSISENIKATEGVLVMNEGAMVDPDKGLRREGGITTIRVRSFQEEFGAWFQATAFGQDVYLYKKDLIASLADEIGTPPVMSGKAFAADSGIKFSEMYDVATQFHNPIAVGLVLSFIRLARMWRMNERQFGKEADIREFPVEDKTGIPVAFEYSGAMKEMESDYPLEIEAFPLTPSSRDVEFKEMERLFALVPDLPRDLLLRLSNLPKVVERANLEARNAAGLEEILNIIGNTEEGKNILMKFVGQFQEGAKAE